jgi:hypothetical protein
MKIGLVGGSYQERSLPFDAQRSVNLYPVLDKEGKEVSALYGTPGLDTFSTAGVGSVRGCLQATNGRAFAVSGSKLYEVNSAGTSTELGTLDGSSGLVTMAENGFQLGICDGDKIYIFTYATPATSVTNGTFASDTGWTKGAGWTIAAGVADAAGGISTALSQTAGVALVEGRAYTVTFTATRAAGSVTVSVGGTNGTARSSSATFTETIIAGSTQIIAFTGAGFTGTIDTVSVTPAAFEKVTDADLPSAGTITFIDGYFVINKNGTGAKYISALYNGFSWNALDFVSAESSPDLLKRVFAALGQLFDFGAYTTEVFTNTGSSSFPFERIAGGKMEVGIVAPHTAVGLDNAVFWVGQDALGRGIVYRASGFTPQRVSTHAIEQAIARATDIENMFAFAYQQDGHTFYFLSGGGLETSLVFDLTTGYWHERAYLNAEGNFETHLASCCMSAFGKHLVGSRLDGKIYDMSPDYFDDDGDEIAAERTFTHLSDEGRAFRMNALEVAFETGVGLQSGQGSDPVASMLLSKDGGRTFIDCGTASLGAVGQYNTKVVWRRLGIAHQATFKIRVTDPVKRAMCGSYLN